MSRLRQVKRIVEEGDTTAGRAFDLFIQLLIGISLVSFAMETLPGLAQGWRQDLRILEIVTVVVFSAEYLLRLTVADSKARFILSFYGLVDLAAILPFYIASGIDLRSIRVLRMMRLFRILKLGRYSRAINRFHQAFRIAREEVLLFLSASLILLYVSAVGIYYFERDAQPGAFGSVFHSLWWAVATLTTVGYGDAYPVTAGGRIFTAIVLLIGLGVVAVPAGLVASALSEARRLEEG